MKKSPKVSVIMSVYKDGLFLKNSIESIINQSFQDFEFIIIDDCADVVTREILNKYEERYKKLIVLHNKKNLGLAMSLNSGISIAKGQYIARMDGDDISLPSRIGEQVKFLDSYENIYLVGSYIEKIDEKGNVLGEYKPPLAGSSINTALEKYNPFVHSSIMFRNDGQVFYREKFKAVQDYDFYLRIKDLGLEMANLNQILLQYRISSKHTDISRMLKHSSYKYLALDFHEMRVKKGEDNYEKFDPNTFEKLTINNLVDGRVLKDVIFSFYKSRKKQECIRYSEIYFKKFGVNLYVVFIYLRSRLF